MNERVVQLLSQDTPSEERIEELHAIFAEFPKETDLYFCQPISACAMSDLAWVINYSQRIERLSFYEVQLDERVFKALGRILQQNTRLTDLSINSCVISDDSAKALCDGLHGSRSIELLELSQCQLSNNGVLAIVRAITGSKTLSHLGLSGNEIGDRTLHNIVHSLAANTCLSHLDLSANNITAASAGALAQLLRAPWTLATLELDENQIGDEGASLLAEELHANVSLRKLTLGRAQIGDSVAKILAEALEFNSTLESLCLVWNDIGNVGALALANGLSENTGLLELDLSHNKIRDNGILSICHNLRVNDTLQQLTLDGNPYNNSCATDALSENSRLTFYTGPGEDYSERNLDRFPITLLYFVLQVQHLASQATGSLSMDNNVIALILANTYLKPSNAYAAKIVASFKKMLSLREQHGEKLPCIEPPIDDSFKRPRVDDELSTFLGWGEPVDDPWSSSYVAATGVSIPGFDFEDNESDLSFGGSQSWNFLPADELSEELADDFFWDGSQFFKPDSTKKRHRSEVETEITQGYDLMKKHKP